MNENDVKNLFGREPKEEKVIDIGETVICDICNDDYTNRDDQGGFIFSGNAYCPKCAESRIEKIRSFNEEKFITDRCPDHVAFADFVRVIRGGNNKIIISSF